MKILSITTGFDPGIGLILFGLGDDNLVYRWDAKLGGWAKNWFEQKPLMAPNAPERERAAAARKAAGKRKK